MQNLGSLKRWVENRGKIGVKAVRQQGNASHKEKTVSYIDGNTVRKLQPNPSPSRRSEEIHQELIEKQKLDREQRERKRALRAAARRNQEKALQMNPGYVLFLAAAMMVLVGVSGVYLKLQAELTTRINHVASLKSEVMDLKISNDAEQKRIDTSVNLDEVKQKATEGLGMVYPGKEQIIYFEIDNSDYMNQYQDIPAK